MDQKEYNEFLKEQSKKKMPIKVLNKIKSILIEMEKQDIHKTVYENIVRNSFESGLKKEFGNFKSFIVLKDNLSSITAYKIKDYSYEIYLMIAYLKDNKINYSVQDESLIELYSEESGLSRPDWENIKGV